MNAHQIEFAARELCRIRGIDPESHVPCSPPTGPGGVMLAVYVTQYAWHAAASEILGFYQVAQAIDLALGGEGEPGQ